MKKIILLFLLMTVPLFAQSALISESDTTYVIDARLSVRFNLNDFQSAASQIDWADSVIDDWLNQACWEIASAGMLKKLDTVITADNTCKYALNADFMACDGVMLKNPSGRWSALDSVGMAGFGGDANKSTISDYYVYSKHLFLDATPVVGGDSLVVFYSGYANDLTAGDSTIINIPYQYQIAVIEGAVKRALRADDISK